MRDPKAGEGKEEHQLSGEHNEPLSGGMSLDGRFRETLGRYLRRERESRSVSLKELSHSTRISRPYLEALERDDFSFFSQREFIPGFLKGYTRHLGLNTEEVLRRYRLQAELAGRKETFEQIPLFPAPFAAPAAREKEPEKALSRPTSPPRARRSRWRLGLQLAVIGTALSLSLYLHSLLQETSDREKRSGNGKGPSQAVQSPKPSMTERSLKTIGSRKDKTYLVPGMKGYGKIDAEDRVEFESEEEAKKAGYRKLGSLALPPGKD